MKKINILSFGRFHMLDLARELDNLGYDVKFYSIVPPRNIEKFGFPSEKSISLFYILLPLIFLGKYSRKLDEVRRIFQDLIIMFIMRKCDVTISLTGFIYAPKKAKYKYNSTLIFERGSKHILEQKRILGNIEGKVLKIPNVNIELNLKAYAIADYISVGATHVKDSFLKNSYPLDKIFVNTYGVNLSQFYKIDSSLKKFDVIMVGGWSYRKGCDLLIKAVRELNISLLHVGSIVDCDFPNEENFVHIEPVTQDQLVNYYNQAKIFVLPSREEGLAMVQAQAITCNLPIVCSKDSGGEDLKKYFNDNCPIFVINNYTNYELEKNIQKALNYYYTNNGEFYNIEGKQKLTWSAYGVRYADFLDNIILKNV